MAKRCCRLIRKVTCRARKTGGRGGRCFVPTRGARSAERVVGSGTLPSGYFFGSGTGIGNTNGARRVGHVLTFKEFGRDAKLTGWAHDEGNGVGAGVGGADAKHAGGDGAVDSAASAVVAGVGGAAVGDTTRTSDVVVGCIGDVRCSGASVARISY